MAKNKVEWREFGGEDGAAWIVIDDRPSTEGGQLILNVDNGGAQLTHKKWWKNVKWSPIALIPIDGRFTPAEYKKRAQAICDHLNAEWVKEKLSE